MEEYKRRALIEFSVRAARDFTESDKMFMHMDYLKQKIGYNAYLVKAKQDSIEPLTFEKWLYMLI